MFGITGVASMIAYLWMFIVLQINTPDYVDLWEAIVTLVAFVVLVLLAYCADIYNARKMKRAKSKEDLARQVDHRHLRDLANIHSPKSLIELAQGLFKGQQFEKGKTLQESQERVQKLFMSVMQVDSLEGCSMDDYLNALQPESPLERIAFRLQVAKYTTNKKDFMRLEKGTVGQIENQHAAATVLNEYVGFKCLHYSVAESSITVNLTIEKRVNEEYTFWIKTEDGTAKAPEDYTAKNELITMKANEKERIIKIGIIDS